MLIGSPPDYRDDERFSYHGFTTDALQALLDGQGGWWDFREARKGGDFGGMIGAEARARAAGERFATALREEGRSDADVAAWLDWMRQSVMEAL